MYMDPPSLCSPAAVRAEPSAGRLSTHRHHDGEGLRGAQEHTSPRAPPARASDAGGDHGHEGHEHDGHEEGTTQDDATEQDGDE